MENTNSYSKNIEIRWSDLDPNFHLRHSAYYDLGAFVRISIMTENGLTPFLMQQQHIGPILFREECVFKKEIHFSDSITANVQLVKCTKDMSRWSMVHEIWKENIVLCATITIDGAWIDTKSRKLAIPPKSFGDVFAAFPRAANFDWMIR